MRGVVGKQVALQHDTVTYLGPRELSLYYVSNITITTDDIPQGSNNHGRRVSVTVVMQRQLLANIINVFIPTVLMTLIGHCTNYFEERHFDAVVTLNLTTMLLLTTMFATVNAHLPTTSYIKMIDIWLCVNLFIPCIEILLHVYMNTLREDLDNIDIVWVRSSTKVAPEHLQVLGGWNFLEQAL